MTARLLAFIIVTCLLVLAVPLYAGSLTMGQSAMSSSLAPLDGTLPKVIWRTSHWLCQSNEYGITGAMPDLVKRIHASVIMIYFKDTSISRTEWSHLHESVDFWRAKGKIVWLIDNKATWTETAGTPTSVQYVIDEFKGEIAGILFDCYAPSRSPSEMQEWLVAKKNLLAENGLECGYYHGDDFSPNYGDPSTDVDATYLSGQRLIPMAWLQDDNSWKPMTFDLPRFWVDYDILTGQGGDVAGQSYDEIYNQWYLGNVIGQDDLKNNAGCEALVFMCYTTEAFPNPDAQKGMEAVANDWLKRSNIIDAVAAALAFGSIPGDPNWNPAADLNGDGMVDLFDMIIFTKNF